MDDEIIDHISADRNAQDNFPEPLKKSTDEAEEERTSHKQDGWTELMGSDLLLKIISRDESISPRVEVQPHDAVRVAFIGRYADSWQQASSNDGPIFQAVDDWLVIVAEKDVLPCLELAIRFMSVGDTALVWSHSKYAYGASRRRYEKATTSVDDALPAHAHVCYQVSVRNVIPDDERERPEFALEMAVAKKEMANDIYAHEIWSSRKASPDGVASTKGRAVYLYNRAIMCCDQLQARLGNDDGDGAETDSLLTRASTVYIDCLNNLAAVYLRVKEYKQAKEAAVRVLGRDANNVKALVRAAKASLHDPASDYEEVRASIQAAQEVLHDCTHGQDDNADELRTLRKALQTVKADFLKRKHDYKMKQKEMMSKMSQALQPTVDVGSNRSYTADNQLTSEGTAFESPVTNKSTRALGADSAEVQDTLDQDLEKLKELRDVMTNDAQLYEPTNWHAHMRRSFLQVALPVALFLLVRVIVARCSNGDGPSHGADEL